MTHGYFLRIHQWTAIIGLSICLFGSAVTARNTEPQTADGASRGQGVVKIKAADGNEVSLYAESHALVIGASDYGAGWHSLPGVKTDVAEVERSLKANGFEVQTLPNPTRSKLLGTIDEFINLYGFNPDNRLLVYFAGHGHTLKAPDGRNLGFIVPIDAPDPAKDLEGFNRKAIGMQEVLNFARRIQSKHALFVFDSCFSGSLFRGATPTENPKLVPAVILGMSTKPVRQFITAGTDTQAVPDDSIFCKMFVRGLDGEADLNHDGFITGSELGMYLQDWVAKYSDGKQTPRIEKIVDRYLDLGDFLFSSPKTARTPVAGSAEASESKPPKAIQAEDKPDGPTSQGEVLWKTTTDKGLQLSVSEGWVGTGIQVKTGEEVRISASGSFDLGAFGSSGPEGVLQNDPKKPLPGCQTGAVIAKVGNVLTCARNSNKFTSSQTGELYLSINESNYSDNSGSVNIRIEILSPFKSK